MQVLPVQADSDNNDDNASMHHSTLADMDIVDNISGDYGLYIHDNATDYIYGEEYDYSSNNI